MDHTVKHHRLLQVATSIETTHDRFDMRRALHACGTPGCIAGYTLALFAPDTDHTRVTEAGLALLAKKALGLTSEETDDLFFPHSRADAGRSYSYGASRGLPGYISWDHAVATLRHFAETGTIDWALTRPVSTP